MAVTSGDPPVGRPLVAVWDKLWSKDGASCLADPHSHSSCVTHGVPFLRALEKGGGRGPHLDKNLILNVRASALFWSTFQNFLLLH